MDFAVDQASVHKSETAKAETSSVSQPSPSLNDLLLAGKPVRMLASRQRAPKPVEVSISDLYERDGRLLIRYSIRNRRAQPYQIENPHV